jgi:ClpP class serine protease
MIRRYERIATFVQEFPFAMMQGPLEAMLEVFELRLTGRGFSDDEIHARLEAIARREAPAPQPKQIAVLPVYGVLAHRMNLITAMSGGMSTEQLGGAVRAAASDPTISAILLDIDSPGGSVFGVQELADEIYQARQSKPVYAIANATAASAAYWIGSQASEFVVTPSGQVGSIGVVAVHAAGR